MFKNYFNAAVRNLLKNKGFSFINILGLAIGMASAMLIFLWIQNQVSHDRFHKNGDRLYVANNRDEFKEGELWAWAWTPKILALTLKQDYPEVEDAVRTSNISFLLTVGDKKLNVGGVYTDPSFLKVFSFPLVHGSIKDALSSVNNIVITEKLAIRLFGSTDVIGKVVKVDSTDNFNVAGVLKNLPNNTEFSFEYLLPWSYLKKRGNDDSYWGNNSVKTFVLLKPGTDQKAFDAKIRRITIEHSVQNGDRSSTEVFTQKFSDSWLYSKPVNGKYVSGRIEMVRLFTVVAIFILLIACINFMNLSTARSEKRSREVGIRKVVGAPRYMLIVQFIGESVLLSFIAGMLALLLVTLSLPWYNQLVGIELHLNFLDLSFWLVFLGFILLTGIVAGSYPAFFLSSFRPIKTLKGVFHPAGARVSPRKILVVLQFSFAIILIISTIVVKHQINYALSRNTGYSRDNLVFSYMQGDVEKHYELIRNELLTSGAVVSVTKTMSPITERYSDGWGFSWTGSTPKDEKTDFIRMSADAGFTQTMGIRLLKGRDIDIYTYKTDSNAMLVNEAAMKVMRLKDPIGKTVQGDGKTWHIVGVIRDFIWESPYSAINPLLVMGPHSWFSTVHYRLNPQKPVAEALRTIGAIFNKYNPEYPFEYLFADQEYARKFKEEQRTATLATLFAGLTIFISCLGLFGLAAYMAENRTKEIGIRKVLGATVFHITSLLSFDFLKLVIISFFIASPLAWYLMSLWLKNYEYRIHIEWWVFVLACMLSLVIAILTISFQSIKAAIANPVKSLRTE